MAPAPAAASRVAAPCLRSPRKRSTLRAVWIQQSGIKEKEHERHKDAHIRTGSPRNLGCCCKLASKDVFNGDIGTVEQIDAVEHQVGVRFDDRMVKYDFGELDEVAPAYAVTIHKSQGSEFPAVVIPLATQHYMLLQRNLIYTGITRGKKLVVLIGQRKALGIAIHNDRPQRRYSGLLASLKGKKSTEGSAVESKTASQSRVVP